MYMPLLANESGIIKFSTSAGTILQTGDLLGTLNLDDPSRVKYATPFDGQFPSFG